MTGRAEEKRTVILPERIVVIVHCNRVRGLVLAGEAYVVADTIFLLEIFLDCTEGLLEKFPVLWGNRECQVDRAVGIAHVFLSFDKMLRECCPGPAVGIPVELQYTFGLAAVAESFGFEQDRGGLEPVFPGVFRCPEKIFVPESELAD